MTTQTIYQWVKASESDLFIIDAEQTFLLRYKKIEESESWQYREHSSIGRIKWYLESGFNGVEYLSPITTIILTPEQAEAYEKCVEILDANIRAMYEYISPDDYKEAFQALQQLNKVKP